MNMGGSEDATPLPASSERVAIRYMGDYLLVGEIASGGMGSVFQARQLSLNRKVAIKLIRAGHAPPDIELQRFRTEAEAAARLDHPNIVPIYEIGEHEGQPYLSMQLVDGESLADLLGEDPSNLLPHRQAAEVVAKVARAVHHAHQRGVLHRDIKPGNILLDAAGEPHLTDFGLARLRDSSQSLTATQSTLGTPAYMAPEVAAAGAREATISADIYSLGAVLYHLLTGHSPFTGNSPLEVLDRVRNQDPLPPRSLARSIPHDLEQVCLKALRREPMARYASAADLAEDLGRYLRGEPIQAQPLGWCERAWRACRRRPLVSALSVALLLAVALGAVAVGFQWQRTQAANRELRHANALAQLRAAEGLFQLDQPLRALPILAGQLRRDPNDSLAANRLLSALTWRGWALPFASLGPQPSTSQRVVFSRDGTRVLTADSESRLRVWDAASAKPVIPFFNRGAAPGSLAFSPDGRLVAELDQNGTLRVFSLRTEPAEVFCLSNVATFAFTRKEGSWVTAQLDEGARFWRMMGPDSAAEPKATSTGQDDPGPRPSSSAIPRPVSSAALGGPAEAMVLSCDGTGLATATNQIVSVWEVESGRIIATLHHTNAISLLRFRADGARLLAVTKPAGGPMLYVWHVASGRLLWARPSPVPVALAAFSPDGRWVAVSDESSGDASYLFDAETGQLLYTSPARTSLAMDTPFSPGSDLLLLSARSSWLRLQQVPSHQPAAEPIPTTSFGFEECAFSPDGRRLAACMGSETLLYDLRITPTLAPETSTSAWEIVSSPSRDSKSLLTGTTDHSVQLRSIPDLRPLGPPLPHAARVDVLALAPAGTPVATVCADGFARVWDPQSGALTLPPLAGVPHGRKLAFTRDGSRLVCATEDARLHVWSVADGSRPFPAASLRPDLTNGGLLRLTAWQLGPGDQRAALGWADGCVQVRDLASSRLLFEVHHEGPVKGMVFSPDGKVLATAAADGTLRLWDANTGRLKLPPIFSSDPLMSLKISPDGTLLLAGCYDGSAKVWRAQDGGLLAECWGHEDYVQGTAFDPRGTTFVTGAWDGHLRFWDVATGLPLSDFISHGHDTIQEVEFTPDGRWVGTWSANCRLRFTPVLRATVPAPDWLPILAECLAGSRQLPNGPIQPVPASEFLALRARLQTLPGNDFYAVWARWFFSDRTERWPGFDGQ